MTRGKHHHGQSSPSSEEEGERSDSTEYTTDDSGSALMVKPIFFLELELELFSSNHFIRAGAGALWLRLILVEPEPGA